LKNLLAPNAWISERKEEKKKDKLYV
jgi:hypothetical protein